ncbi:Uncharacterized protein GBIM_17452 [Gryllus bimaculatus]|nr:Uncharacterized protein GBIM_17452 [Gryllus bimaculatus]
MATDLSFSGNSVMQGVTRERGRDVHLSKTLSWLLRHGAVKEGVPITEDGFISVSEILKHSSLKHKYTLQDIERVVEENNKKRFTLTVHPQTGDLLIKANQGHSMKIVNDTSLQPILDASEAPVVVHGTYSRNWDSIKRNGLSCMNRLHIHFAPGEPGEPQVISGIRGDCDTYIYIKVADALKDGIKFYRSANNVILSPGNDTGILEPKYFDRVVHHQK